MLTISNPTHTPWSGYIPATIPEALLPHQGAFLAKGSDGNNYTCVVGNQVGDARRIWVKIEDLGGAKTVMLDYDEAIGVAHYSPPPIPSEVASDPINHFGCSINQIPFAATKDWLTHDGVAFRGHFRTKCSKLCWADLWITWIPGEQWFRWEMVINAASIKHGADLDEMLPDGFTLRIGDALVGRYGGGAVEPMMKGQSIAQGQARTFAGVGGWWDHMSQDQQAQTIGMLNGLGFAAVDDAWRERVGGMGVPKPQSGWKPQEFIAKRIGRVLRSMETWMSPGLGVVPNAGVTGAQEEQVFSGNGAEVFAGGMWGPAALFMRYLVALTYSRRPCHWREDDGRLLAFDEHPDLDFWGGGPHYHPNVGSDKLGLVNGMPNETLTHGYTGPDREHWFYGSLWLAASMTHSEALQWQGEQQARIVWFRETVDSRWPTSGPDVPRAVGWFGLVVCGLKSSMRDGDAMRRVMDRARQRVDQVYLQQLGYGDGMPHDVWNVRRDDRLSKELHHAYVNVVMMDETTIDGPVESLPVGAVSWDVSYTWQHSWMPYQQAVGAFGLYQLGQLLGHDACKAKAISGARACTELGWTKTDSGIQQWDILGISANPSSPEMPWIVEDNSTYEHGKNANSKSMFRHAWHPLGVWVGLQGEGIDAWADQIWQVIWPEYSQGEGVMSWMPPRDRKLAASVVTP